MRCYCYYYYWHSVGNKRKITAITTEHLLYARYELHSVIHLILSNPRRQTLLFLPFSRRSNRGTKGHAPAQGHQSRKCRSGLDPRLCGSSTIVSHFLPEQGTRPSDDLFWGVFVLFCFECLYYIREKKANSVSTILTPSEALP